MHNLTHAPEITETEATEQIMSGCRANPKRDIAYLGYIIEGCKRVVTFTMLADGTHEACLRDENRVVVALANVDEFDV